MRISGILVWLCLGCVLVGCKNKGDADAAPDPAAIKQQQELIAKRDKLLAARQQLQSDRDKLDAEIKDIQAKGGDPTEQLKKKAELDTQLDGTTSDLLNMVNTNLQAVKQSNDKSAQVAAREAEIGSREKAVADREARIADREKALAQREAEAAQRWKDSCSSGGTMIIQAPAKGGNYTKKDVTDLLAKGKGAMQKKGILTADLPGPAQTLEGEASKALADNDINKAYIYALQFQQNVDAIVINRPFIQAKLARLQKQLQSSKVDDATTQQLQNIIVDVTAKYGDGNYTGANAKLNTLAAMLNK